MIGENIFFFNCGGDDVNNGFLFSPPARFLLLHWSFAQSEVVQ